MCTKCFRPYSWLLTTMTLSFATPSAENPCLYKARSLYKLPVSIPGKEVRISGCVLLKMEQSSSYIIRRIEYHDFPVHST